MKNAFRPRIRNECSVLKSLVLRVIVDLLFTFIARTGGKRERNTPRINEKVRTSRESHDAGQELFFSRFAVRTPDVRGIIYCKVRSSHAGLRN